MVGSAKSLYAYERQTDEELSFRQGQTFNIYDANDVDWILVGDTAGNFGFAPSNYLDRTGAGSQSQPSQAPDVTAAPVIHATPQPVIAQQQQQQKLPNQSKPLPEMPPPEESRYQSSHNRSLRDSSRNGRYSDEDRDKPRVPSKEDPPQAPTQSSRPEEFYTWPVQEVDGKKKYKATLAISNSSVVFTPSKSSSPAQKWFIGDLLYYNSEKKHVFLEFQNPKVSLDLHAGSKLAEEIVTMLGTAAGANKAAGLREVITAANSAGQKMGKVLYDFEAQGDDELSVREGETIFIIDNEQSKEWWMARNSSGVEGVVPSSYVKQTSEPSSSRQPKYPVRSQSGSKSRRSEDKDDRNLRKDSSKAHPDSGKVRTWTDRSGTFKVEAQLLGCVDGKIHLHKLNGVKIAVAASKMSIEDIEYVEQVTGKSLEDDKPLVDLKRNTVKSASATSGVTRANTQGRSTSNSLPGGASNGIVSTNSSSRAEPSSNGPTSADYDWFGFFLDCGIEINNCQRYAINFNRDQMDESVLADITPSVLRTLGMKEGDILRVSKKLDERFDRRKPNELNGAATAQAPINPTIPQQQQPPQQLQPVQQPPQIQQPQQPAQPLVQTQQYAALTSKPQNSFADDAWAVKSTVQAPAQAPSQAPTNLPTPQTSGLHSSSSVPSLPISQPTGALKDFLDFKPPEPVMPVAARSASTSALPLTANQTGGVRYVQTNQTGFANPGAAVVTLPVSIPIQFQPVVSITPQTTGGLVREPLGPFATGSTQVITGNQFTAPLQGQNTGGISIFSQPTVSNQFPNQLQGQATGGNGFVTQITGGVAQFQPTPTPQATFGTQFTGGSNNFSTGFASQPSGNFPAISTSNPFMASQPATPNNFSVQPQVPNNLFGQPAPQPNPTSIFGANNMQQTVNGLSNQFQQVNLQSTQQPSFGTGQSTFQSQFQPQASVPFQQQQQQQTVPIQNPSQPLQSQPTGFGFGNVAGQPQQPMTSFSQAMAPQVSFGGSAQPLQPTLTGRRANLAVATAQNPFGF